MAHVIYDVGVIGAGIEGSAIACTLAQRGVNTILIEQFPLPHTRGSSHGHSRGIRAAYAEKDYLTKMVMDAYPMWRDLEIKSNQNIYKETGLLYFSANGQDVDDCVACFRRHGLHHTVMSENEVKEKYPGFRLSGGFKYVMETAAGVLRASAALKAFQELFIQHGGVVKDSCPVLNIVPGTGSAAITLMTSRGTVTCQKICLAAGPWTNKLLSAGLSLQLPLTVQRITVPYWRLKEGMDMDDHPNFIYAADSSDDDVYSVMGDEYPGHVKVCPHGGPGVDPDSRDQAPQSGHLEAAQRFVSDCLPRLDATQPAVMETCLYTRTPDNDYILDHHPRHKSVYIAAGFSGHGFKMAPVIGRIMADLIENKKSCYDLTPFRLNRFEKKAKL